MPTMSWSISNLRAVSRRFNLHAAGVSAVEFALVLPFLLLLYLGGVELVHAVSVDRKVTATAGAIGDLVAQSTEVSSGDMTDIFNAASAILAPYKTDTLQIVVTSVMVDDDGTSVRWSTSQNGICRAAGESVFLPAELSIPGQSVIVAEARYRYEAGLGRIFIDGITFSDTFYLRPRLTSEIEALSELPC